MQTMHLILNAVFEEQFHENNFNTNLHILTKLKRQDFVFTC